MSIQLEPTGLWKQGIAVIPTPQRVEPGEGRFILTPEVVVALSGKTDAEDEFTARLLAEELRERHGLRLRVGCSSTSSTGVVRLVRGPLPTKFGDEGYTLDVTPEAVVLGAATSAGIYYTVQTLLQLITPRDGRLSAPCLRIEDRPDYRWRAVHYDTKHHQDTFEYVQSFIRMLASYKVNLLVWEWEDKFAYRKHPEIGAPGAFTPAEMRRLSAFARRHHVQIVPLVQGLGHVSYILKHEKHRWLREVPASAWEFCPRREGTYRLLFDLWDEAIEATPESEFLHIGTDECYELGRGEACGCRKLADERGKEHLMQMFIRRSEEHVTSRGRRVLSWGGGYVPGAPEPPPKDLITFTYLYKDLHEGAAPAKGGYRNWIFCPNCSIPPLFVMLFPWDDEEYRGENPGSLRATAEALSRGKAVGCYDGIVLCTWDDSGLHNQMFSMRVVCAAEYSWNAEACSVDEFTAKFFTSYFGPEAMDLEELFRSLQKRTLFFYRTLQRQVWHYGDVGKMQLPDLPRWDLEYDPFWRKHNAEVLQQAKEELVLLDRAAAIVHENVRRPLRHLYDLEAILTIIELCRLNARFFTRMEEVEAAVADASRLHFVDRRQALGSLRRAAWVVAEHLDQRRTVFKTLVKVWERTRLRKGMSTKRKRFVHHRDRARHFANRTPDMRYLILDEERLDLEGWLISMKRTIRDYAKTV